MSAWRWLGFAVICAWQATAWLVPAISEGPSALERLILSCALIAIFAAVTVRRESFAGLRWGFLAVAAVLLIGAPAVLLLAAADYATDTSITAVFALTPCVVVLAWAAVSSRGVGMAALIPALAGVGGILLVLPYELPVSRNEMRSFAEVILAMLLTGLGMVWVHRLTGAASAAVSLFVAAIANLVFLSLFEIGRHPTWQGGGVAVWFVVAAQAVCCALTVWLSGVLLPVRLAARFLVVPLLTILEGLLLVRPEVDARLAVGLVLVAAGAVWLLVRGGRVDDQVLSLR